jgi:hypothetical protein
MDRQLLAVKLPVPVREIRRVPAWEFVGDYLKSISFPAPVLLPDGWEQARPNDPAINVGYRHEKAVLWVSVDYGRQKVARALAQDCRQGWTTARRRSAAWWKSYWRDVPAVEVPNPRLQFIYQYGMYKLAESSQPTGIPAGLQGPWLEEYQMPPWSGDYHSNIIVLEGVPRPTKATGWRNCGRTRSRLSGSKTDSCCRTRWMTGARMGADSGPVQWITGARPGWRR